MIGLFNQRTCCGPLIVPSAPSALPTSERLEFSVRAGSPAFFRAGGASAVPAWRSAAHGSSAPIAEAPQAAHKHELSTTNRKEDMQTAVMQSGRHRTNSDLGSPGERKGEEWVRSLLRRAKSESTPAGLTSSVPTCLCPPGDGANTRNRPTPHGDDPCPCRCPGEPTPSPRWWALPAAPAVPRWRRPSPPRPRFLALPADADPPPEHADGGDGFVDIPIAVPGLATWGCHCPDGEALSGSDSDSTAGSEASGVDWRSVSPDPEPDSDDDARTASPCPSPALLPAFDSPPSEEDLHTWALTSIGGRALFPELRPQRRRVRFCPQPEVGWTWSKDEYERGLDEEEQKELVKRLMDGLFAGLACPGDAAGTRDGSRRSAGGFACQ